MRGKPIEITRYSYEEVVAYAHKKLHTFRVDGIGYTQKLDLPSISCFVDNPKCVCCGLEGTHFILTKFSWDKDVSLVFYHISKDLRMLMTVDHIIPRALRGSNDISNLQTMCHSCNNLKAEHNVDIATLRIALDIEKKTDRRTADLWLLEHSSTITKVPLIVHEDLIDQFNVPRLVEMR